MILFFIIKSLSVLYYSSRNINYGFPFDSYGFDPFHRFTDYLIIWEQAIIKNTYDLSAPIYKVFNTPAPYGFLQFLLIKIIPFKEYGLTKYINFFLVLLTFIYINGKIYSIDKDKKSVILYILFLAFIATNYPLFFLVDRGNLDIYAGVLISILIYRCLTRINDQKNLTNALLIGCLVCLKPSFGIYIFIVLFFFNFKYLFITCTVICFFYLVPVLFYGADLFYLIKDVAHARQGLGLPSIYCNNLSCGIRSLNLNPNIYFSIIISLLTVPYFIFWCKRIASLTEEKNKLYFYLLVATVATLLINDPSPDYRLIFLIPFFLSFNRSIDLSVYSKIEVTLLIMSFVFIFGYTNVYFKSLAFNYFTLLRLIGIFGFFQLVMIGMVRVNEKKLLHNTF